MLNAEPTPDDHAPGKTALTSETGGDDAASVVSPEAVQGEIQEFLRSHVRRRTLIPRAALVGALAGLIGVAFRITLDKSGDLRNGLVDLGHRHPSWGFMLPVLLGALCAVSAVLLVRRIAPETKGSGIPHLKAVLHHLRGMRGERVLPVKFLGGFLGLAGGLALGREGPTIQMGGAVGQLVARGLRTTSTEQRTLIAAGAGAGLAAAFNAPLAGVVFVLEEIQQDFTPGVFTAAFIASITADILARLLLGQHPVFHVTALSPPPLSALPLFLVLGLVTGCLAVVFNRSLLASVRLFQSWRRCPDWLPAALVGMVVGAVAWFCPDAVAGGHRLMARTLAGQEALSALALLFLLRFGLTMISYGIGAPGGIFAPLLLLGAQLGLIVGKLATRLFPHASGTAIAFAVVGMGAYFTGIVRAPLTAVVLMTEMTGSYSLMLPLLVACLTAYGVAEFLGDRPIYEALLERDLLHDRTGPVLEETLLLELTLQPGSPFEKKRVSELQLPDGCLLISLRRGLRDEVPTGQTTLERGDRLTALIAPRAASAASQLRHGCGTN